MNTLKALKDAIRPGTRIEVVDHWIAAYRGTRRVVTDVQGNGHWFQYVNESGAEKRSWSPALKRSETTFNDDGTVTFRPADLADRGAFWTLRILPQEVAE